MIQTNYDIIKAHGGEIKLETKVDEGNTDDFGKGEGTKFIIQNTKHVNKFHENIHKNIAAFVVACFCSGTAAAKTSRQPAPGVEECRQ